ncbi:MAG: 2-oxoacid:acceptor oxidoreductase family protein [Bacteroidales bacterium]|nr:2-oxoacid:acceptor oxidoreductase family protein [Anaerotignum sp.]MCI5680074.1 2-oxoacid:acceptor oxidoreductase family protein [Bacteroidales bacterium]MDY3927728.1 2-oxoacid:acceptor oxidoreductase family protein [Anaerotignum sp.]
MKLPVTNENGYFEIRLESIGGLGANLCGKMLGELGAVTLGLNAASFSSYGSEKRGSPVKAYIRWAEENREIGINSPVETPHILGLFHEALAGKLPVTAGVTEKTKIVINTDASPEEMRKRLKLCGGEIFCIDALNIAIEAKTRVNMVMLGAIAKASGFVPLDAAEEIARVTIGKKYPALLEANLEGLRRGYQETKSAFFKEDGTYERVPYQEAKNKWGYENAPIGGTNPRFGSTVSNDLSASREGYIPLFIQENCINCGLCDSTCPDMVFQFEKGEYKGKPAMVNRGLDYHHCKGCLRCVDVCPTNALVMGVEREHPQPKWFVRNKDLIVDKMEFEDAGPNSWITSESFLTEKRVDGGVV